MERTMENSILDTSKYRVVRLIYSKGKYIIPSRKVLMCSFNTLDYALQERDKIAQEEGFTYNEKGRLVKYDEDGYIHLLYIWYKLF
jgi:hypothetical protein